MFMTPAELSTLTGYALNAWQRRWLNARGWKFEQAANGRPVVSRSYAESRLSDHPVEKSIALNLDVIRKAA